MPPKNFARRGKKPLMKKWSKYMGLLKPRQLAFTIPTIALVWTVTYWRLGLSFYSVIMASLFALLVIISVADWKTREIKVCLLVCIALLAIPNFFASDISLVSHLFGAAIISIPLSAFSKQQKGIGAGDIGLVAVCGLVIGMESIIFGVFFGMIIAVIAGLIIRAITGARSIALAPWLSLGITAVILF